MEAEVSRTWENYYQHKSREITREWANGRVARRKLRREDAPALDGVSSLEQRVRHFTQRYLAGDTDVQQYVWGLVWNVQVGRASRMGISYDAARDVATDAMVYARDYALANPDKIKSLMALFNNSTSLFALRYRDGRDFNDDLSETELLAAEDGIMGEEEDDPEPLVSAECAEWETGRQPHPYLTSINITTPEDEALSENLRGFMERTAIETCGQEAWNIYYAAVVQEQPQVSIAEARGVSPATISRTVRTVGEALKAALLGTS